MTHHLQPNQSDSESPIKQPAGAERSSRRLAAARRGRRACFADPSARSPSDPTDACASRLRETASGRMHTLAGRSRTRQSRPRSVRTASARRGSPVINQPTNEGELTGNVPGGTPTLSTKVFSHDSATSLGKVICKRTRTKTRGNAITTADTQSSNTDLHGELFEQRQDGVVRAVVAQQPAARALLRPTNDVLQAQHHQDNDDARSRPKSRLKGDSR